MRTYSAIFLLFLFLMGSCHEEESGYAKIIKNNAGKNSSLYVQGDTNSIILPLETTSEALIGSYDKILMNDTVICIVDQRKEKTIFIYSNDGKYKTKICRLGRGPKEYVGLDDVLLKKDSLLILDRANRKLLYFGLNGDFYREVKFKKYRPIPFAVLDNARFVFYVGMPGHSEQNAEVIVTDLWGNTLRQYVERPHLTDKQGRFHLPDYFAVNDHGVFFIPVFEDKIYQLQSDTIKEIFDFAFKNLMYSFDEINVKSMLDQERKYSYFSGFHMANDGTFVCFNHRGKDPVDVCGNIFTRKLVTWRGDCPIYGTYKDYFITTIENDCKQENDTLGNNHSLLFIKGQRLLE